MSLGQLKGYLLKENEQSIKKLSEALSSDVISCLVKLMTNEELITVGAKIFNPLPGSKIGEKGYRAYLKYWSEEIHIDRYLNLIKETQCKRRPYKKGD